jgi:hypothetical protein
MDWDKSLYAFSCNELVKNRRLCYNKPMRTPINFVLLILVSLLFLLSCSDFLSRYISSDSSDPTAGPVIVPPPDTTPQPVIEWPDPAGCYLELSGGTGNEPGGMIPVCCVPGDEERTRIEAMFILLNEHRSANNIALLTYDHHLGNCMQAHCRHMAIHPFFDHNAPEAAVTDPWTRAALCGATASGENIAFSYATAQNVINPGFTRVGVGYYEGYWGQLFGQ